MKSLVVSRLVYYKLADGAPVQEYLFLTHTENISKREIIFNQTLEHMIEAGCVSSLECQVEKAIIFLSWYFVKMAMTVEKVGFGLCCFLDCNNIVLI